MRTGGRVVEGTALEMRRTREGTVSSNLTLSAKHHNYPFKIKYLRRHLLAIPMPTHAAA